MARKVETIVTLTDDLDGTKADRTITFSFDGTSYEIDLSKKNASTLEKAFAPYISAARKSPRSSKPRSASTSRTRSRSDLGDVREWAKGQGMEVSERGRVAQSVQDAYDSAH